MEEIASHRPRTRREFQIEFLYLGRCIDDLLVGHHALRACLKPGHPPFETSMPDAMAALGTGPVFALWNECRLMQQLRDAWVGPSPTIPDAAPKKPGTKTGTRTRTRARTR